MGNPSQFYDISERLGQVLMADTPQTSALNRVGEVSYGLYIPFPRTEVGRNRGLTPILSHTIQWNLILVIAETFCHFP